MKNVLLIGDSICMGYRSYVKEMLCGKAEVFFPEENGRFLQYTLRALSDWIGGWPGMDVVCWNNGLWDLMHLSSFAAGNDGEAAGDTFTPANLPSDLVFEKEALTPPDIYLYMLKRVHARIRNFYPAAKIVFNTTTPVIEEQSTWAYRSRREVELYNRIARETLVPLGVRINELGDFAAENCESMHRDWVHYNEDGSRLLAGEIVDFLFKENLL